LPTLLKLEQFKNLYIQIKIVVWKIGAVDVNIINCGVKISKCKL
jgi:hypothetical protein